MYNESCLHGFIRIFCLNMSSNEHFCVCADDIAYANFGQRKQPAFLYSARVHRRHQCPFINELLIFGSYTSVPALWWEHWKCEIFKIDVMWTYYVTKFCVFNSFSVTVWKMLMEQGDLFQDFSPASPYLGQLFALLSNHIIGHIYSTWQIQRKVRAGGGGAGGGCVSWHP